VRIEYEEQPHLTSRDDATAPFWGGAVIKDDPRAPFGCSSGFGVHARGREYLLTVGHCGWPGITFWNGTGQRIGTVENGDENVGHDLMLIRTDASDRIHDGRGILPLDSRPAFLKSVSG
jgi:hypothetical protein